MITTISSKGTTLNYYFHLCRTYYIFGKYYIHFKLITLIYRESFMTLVFCLILVEYLYQFVHITTGVCSQQCEIKNLFSVVLCSHVNCEL